MILHNSPDTYAFLTYFVRARYGQASFPCEISWAEMMGAMDFEIWQLAMFAGTGEYYWW